MNKKIVFLMLTLAYVPFSYADDDDCDEGYFQQPPAYYYQPQPQVYYPPQQSYNYPQPNYYARPQQYNQRNNYNRRTHQGLAGSVIGDVLGYEAGNGDPIISGIGAAAGAFLGNRVGRGY